MRRWTMVALSGLVACTGMRAGLAGSDAAPAAPREGDLRAAHEPVEAGDRPVGVPADREVVPAPAQGAEALEFFNVTSGDFADIYTKLEGPAGDDNPLIATWYAPAAVSGPGSRSLETGHWAQLDRP